jgi:hypothetical protein
MVVNKVTNHALPVSGNNSRKAAVLTLSAPPMASVRKANLLISLLFG